MAPSICRYSTPLIVVVYFITQLLVEGTNLYNCTTWIGGMKEHLVSDVVQSLVWCMSWLLLYTWYMTQRDTDYWSSAEQFFMPCLHWHLVKFPHWYGGESYADRAGPLENLLCSEAWSCTETTLDCLVLSAGAHWMRNSYKLRCLVFCSWWWVTVVATSLLLLCLQ